MLTPYRDIVSSSKLAAKKKKKNSATLLYICNLIQRYIFDILDLTAQTSSYLVQNHYKGGYKN